MVRSNLNEKVEYEEFKNLIDEDIEHETSIFEIHSKTLHHKFEVAAGKMNYQYAPHGILYFIVYLIYDDKVASAIGVYEFKADDLAIYVDEKSSELQVDKFENTEPLYFSFVSEKMMKPYSLGPPELQEVDGESDNEENTENDTKDDDEEDNDDEDTQSKSEVIPDESEDKTQEEDGVDAKKTFMSPELHKMLFDEANDQKSLIMNIEEETIEMSKMYREGYMEKLNGTWIENFMHNNQYGIVDNEGDGDCFFAVIRDAFESIGKNTTVGKLRKALSEEVTEELYNNYKEQYLMFVNAVKENKNKMNELKAETKQMKDKYKLTNDRKQQKELGDKLKSNINSYQRIKDETEVSNELMKEFIFMKKAKNIDQFKKIIQSCEFWGETWAISTMERILNVKFILLSSEAYETEDKDNVVHCGQLNDNILETHGSFTPDFYIIVDYNGIHYKLITYKDKYMFRFPEIPYDLRKLILMKCLEGSSGPYNIIEDFHNMKTNLKEEKGIPTSNSVQEEIDKLDLGTDKNYTNTVIFQVYGRSNDKPLPGKGNGEKIVDEEIIKYSTLSKHHNWRRKLSNFWVAPFTIDDYTWSSVEHFIQGSKFRHIPEVYTKFALKNESISVDNSQSKLAQDPQNAKEAASKPRTFGKHITIDPNFTNNTSGLLETAYMAKYQQHPELKQILLDTHNAKITQYTRANEPISMDELMKVRTVLKE